MAPKVNNLKRMKKILLHFTGKYKMVKTAEKLRSQKHINIYIFFIIAVFINGQHVYTRITVYDDH